MKKKLAGIKHGKRFQKTEAEPATDRNSSAMFHKTAHAKRGKRSRG